MSFGFRRNGPAFIHFALYPYPDPEWETCPIGKAICSKAKRDQLFWLGAASRAACGSGAERAANNTCATRVDVSLDGAETKSEDCQIDAGTTVAQAPTTVLD